MRRMSKATNASKDTCSQPLMPFPFSDSHIHPSIATLLLQSSTPSHTSFADPLLPNSRCTCPRFLHLFRIRLTILTGILLIPLSAGPGLIR